MRDKKISVYLAGGWFTPATREILDTMESLLYSMSDIDLYSPRRDGIVLPPNKKHDTALREKIFNENIHHIDTADLVVANIYSNDSYNDPGTMYEIGYAMAHDIPVIGFTHSLDNVEDRFTGILEGFYYIATDYSDLWKSIHHFIYPGDNSTNKSHVVVFVGNGDLEVDHTLATHILESNNKLRWVNEIHDNIYSRIDEIFDGVDYMVVVVDDRKTLASWMIGQAYARGIPVVTYSNHNYGINVMLLVSILTHIRGVDEFVRFLSQVNKEGLESIPPFDISQMESM